jgi:hypothetical protein
MSDKMKILMQLDLHISNDSFSIKLWVGISGSCLTGPHILLAQVNGRDYTTILRAHLNELLKDMCFSICLHIWFQQEAALLN